MTYELHPDLVPLAELIPTVDLSDLAAIRDIQRRAGAAAVDGVDLLGVEVVEGVLPGLSGGPPVPFRSYRGQAGRPASGGALLVLHGGGFVAGSMDDEHRRAVQLARDLGLVILVIDYRLAPEHPYPAALDDATAAVRWLHANAADLAVDTGRIGVLGESAGGALAAGLALRCREEGPPLCVQVLLMPVLDDRGRTGSMRRFTDTPMWTTDMAMRTWRHYLAGLSGEPPATAAPARAEELSDLPPAYITCMELDPLRDEALEYARRLLDHGVSVDLRCYAGAFHGATSIPVTELARRAHADLAEALERRLGTRPG